MDKGNVLFPKIKKGKRKMDFTEIIKQKIDYCSRHTDMPMELQQKAKKLCWEYKQNKSGRKRGKK